jgi:hypothetical protein
MLDVPLAPGEEVVQAEHVVAFGRQPLAEVGAQKAPASCHKDASSIVSHGGLQGRVIGRFRVSGFRVQGSGFRRKEGFRFQVSGFSALKTDRFLLRKTSEDRSLGRRTVKAGRGKNGFRVSARIDPEAFD